MGHRLPQILGAVYLVSELLLTATRRSRGSGMKQDRSTLRMLWIIIFLSVLAALHAVAHWRWAEWEHRRVIAIAGAVLFAMGLALRWWAIVVLGRFFTVDVTIAHDHEIVEAGPYRTVRHPSYTGVLLAFAGFALTLGNYVALVLLLVPIFAAFVRRMNVEEEALSAALGERYRSYMRRTKRLVPYVY